jgi:hypothetical protein
MFCSLVRRDARHPTEGYVTTIQGVISCTSATVPAACRGFRLWIGLNRFDFALVTE